MISEATQTNVDPDSTTSPLIPLPLSLSPQKMEKMSQGKIQLVPRLGLLFQLVLPPHLS